MFVFLCKSTPQVESTESKKGDTADVKAIAKIDADIDECKAQIKKWDFKITKLKTDISMKESELNNAQTNEEKVEIRKQLTLLMTSKAQLETSKAQLETRLTNAMDHLNKMSESQKQGKLGSISLLSFSFLFF